MQLIDGKAIAAKIEANIADAIQKLKGRPPALAFILVGNDPASQSYIKMKKKKCHEVGILSIDRELSANVTESHLIKEIEQLNQDSDVDGILVQLPLPSHINTDNIMLFIDPNKDVDGFHPMNVGKMYIGEQDVFFPCTPHGVQVLLAQSNIATEGKHVVILGRSNLVGKPLAALLIQKRAHANATVTIAHSMSQDLKKICASADILVAAIGKPRFVGPEMVKQGAVVIDVGINRIRENNKDILVGDVDFDQVASKCSHITPVPGGVGPMTIAMLLSNTLLSYQRKLR
ncbi:MAG TPA: bifunctional methylenetetrahydrofolate dehydrogenase/methenyltetrahydrofolate cyclohydrolase FolD [Rhabdochlamydiaceae bacterium]|nr:bifunctional methylenetetrahydrofolate dehydrogenase/methenyltetrahydrofolate cyclohydrolase FolD [Rhabdochlamydiaceae bacterium]